MQPKLLLPLAAAALVLAVPAAANAAITSQINGNALTLTGDATDDNVTIGVNNAGLLTHNFGGDATDFDAVTAGRPDAPQQRHDRDHAQPRRRQRHDEPVRREPRQQHRQR